MTVLNFLDAIGEGGETFQHTASDLIEQMDRADFSELIAEMTAMSNLYHTLHTEATRDKHPITCELLDTE